MLRLSVAGVSVVFGVDDRGVPTVLHFGPDISDAAGEELEATVRTAQTNSGLDVQTIPTIVPNEADDWSGTPAFGWHANGVRPAALALRRTTTIEGGVEFELAESRTNGVVEIRYRLRPSGVLEVAATLTNEGHQTLDVAELRLLMPIPDRAREIQDFTGSWSGERRPQRRLVSDGTWSRSTRRGRTGHDAVTLTSVGTTGFGHRSGEIWSTHVAWSGNAQTIVERLPEGAGTAAAMIGGGELLAGGEIRLGPGEQYSTPPIYFIWSDAGLDGIASRLHAMVRSSAAHPTGPRPLLLNSWEAVYMEHDHARLLNLAEAASNLGIERFVLDDGWFLGRRTDHSGLGDWVVDPMVWPSGLAPLADAVRARGMQFGLWFEPEMINPDSELARAHPEWILVDDLGAGRIWRHQQVLNIGDQECFAYVLMHMDQVITEAGVEFIKWDHNRDLHEAIDRRTGQAGVHRQTAAFYRLIDELRVRHPGLEIEACASGGGRIDLGVVDHAQRVWASDTIDPLERQMIQRGLELIIPLELIGTHVGAARAHTTARATSLPFRLVTALFGHSGVELDLTTMRDDELQSVRTWASLYKQKRELLHSGDVVHADAVPEGSSLMGVVTPQKDEALFQWAQLVTGRPAANPRTQIPGLDPARRYRVRFREEFGRAARRSLGEPAWCATLGGTRTSTCRANC